MTETENIQKISIAEPIQLNINIPDLGNIGKDGKDGTNGKDGRDGDSAYKIAVKNGFVGTEKEWLASLKGGGSSGDNGASLIDIAKRYGLETNEASLVNLLTKGQQLQELQRLTAADAYDPYNKSIVEFDFKDDIPIEEKNTHIMVDNYFNIALIKRTSDSKMFIVDMYDDYYGQVGNGEEITISKRLDRDSTVNILIGINDFTRAVSDPRECETVEGVYCKSMTKGYEIVALYQLGDRPLHFTNLLKTPFACDNSKVNTTVCNIPSNWETLVITFTIGANNGEPEEIHQKTIHNISGYDVYGYYGFILYNKIITLHQGLSLKITDYGEEVELHQSDISNSIITGIFYK